MNFRKPAIIDRLNLAAFDLFDIATVTNPFGAQWRQPTHYIDIRIWIAPRAARVVHARRFVYFDMAAHGFRLRESDFAERDVNARLQFAHDVNAFRVREVVAKIGDRGLGRLIFRNGINDLSYNAAVFFIRFHRCNPRFFKTKNHAWEIAWLNR